MIPLVGALLAITAGILLYVDTRQRSRNLSYILARRMGLRRNDHLLAGFLEIGGLSAIGAVAGIVAATISARTLYSILDPVPGSPPGPRWIGALDLSLISIAVALIVGAGAAVLSQRTADRANAQELLAHGT